MKTYTLTESGAALVGHNVGASITRSDLFDKDPICCSDECGFTIDRENLPKLEIRAHVFLKPEHYELIEDSGVYTHSYGETVGSLEFLSEKLTQECNVEPVFSQLWLSRLGNTPYRMVSVSHTSTRAYLVNENPSSKPVKYGVDPSFFGEALYIWINEDTMKTSKIEEAVMVHETMVIETMNSIYIANFSNHENRDMAVNSMLERGYLKPKSQQRKDL